jgi:probable HAF family extracellular repeat protein
MRTLPGALRATLALIAVTGAAAPALGETFMGLGFATGANGVASESYGISGDGSVVVGACGVATSACRWTQGTGWQLIGNLPPGPHDGSSQANAVNADGSVIVGYASEQAYRWTATTGMVGLGWRDPLNPNRTSVAFGTNADGTIIVGDGTSPNSGFREAWRWTQATGMVGLGFLDLGFRQSSALGISADGNVIVGYSNRTGLITEAFRWTQAAGMVGIGFIDPVSATRSSFAYAANANGSAIVGFDTSSGTRQAFRWTEATGMVGLGWLNPLSPTRESRAYAVNADGTVVVGADNSRVGLASSEAIRWTAANGIQAVKDLAQASGANLTGWTLFEARGVSADGNIVTGFGIDPNGFRQAWLFRLGSGLITMDAAAQSFASLQGTIESTHRAVNAALGTLTEIAAHHGCATICVNAYGLYSAERSPFYNDPDYVGTVGLAKALMRDLSVGVTVGIGTQKDELTNGSADRQRTVSGGVHAGYTPDQGPQVIAGASVSRITATIDRGYLNGNTPVTSTGDTRGTGVGAVLRLGWALPTTKSLRAMPFADYQVTRVRYDGYTETTGPFPATIDAIADTQERVRLGAEARYWLAPQSYLWGTAAWGHRLGDTTAPISGQLIGLFPISIPGSTVSRDWAEATAGVSHAIRQNMIVTASVGALFDGQTSTFTDARTGLSVQF